MDTLLDRAVDWLAGITLAVIKALRSLLSQTAFTTPDVTGPPQVAVITGKSLTVVNVCFILAVITAGIVVMTKETVQVRYGISELAPRLVIGFVAANFAVPICRHLVVLANALTQALTGDGVSPTDSFAQLQRVVQDAMTDPPNAFLTVVIGLFIGALTGMLLVTWLVRLGVLVVLVGVSPVALACHATPSGTFNLFIVACLLWVTIKAGYSTLGRRGLKRGRRRGAGSRALDGYRVDADRDRSEAAVGGSVGVAKVYLPAGVEDEAVKDLRVVGVVGDGAVAGDVRGVVHPAQQEVVVVVEGLVGVVVGEVRWEGHGQPAPGLFVLVPRDRFRGLRLRGR